MKKTYIIAGIDYSFNSPAVCIHSGSTWDLKHCEFYFRSDKKSIVPNSNRIHVDLIKPYPHQEARFLQNATWAREILLTKNVDFIALEGYAMSAKGLVFGIGEHTGCLKQAIRALNIPFIVPPPTVIKKFGSGKGNANKDVMEEAFEIQTKFGMRAASGQNLKQNSPSNDLIDAYFLAKFAHNEIVSGNIDLESLLKQ